MGTARDATNNEVADTLERYQADRAFSALSKLGDQDWYQSLAPHLDNDVRQYCENAPTEQHHVERRYDVADLGVLAQEGQHLLERRSVADRADSPRSMNSAVTAAFSVVAFPAAGLTLK